MFYLYKTFNKSECADIDGHPETDKAIVYSLTQFSGCEFVTSIGTSFFTDSSYIIAKCKENWFIFKEGYSLLPDIPCLQHSIMIARNMMRIKCGRVDRVLVY